MKRELYEVFKDDFDSKVPWRVQLAKGRMDFKLKREAIDFANKLRRLNQNKKV